VAVFDQDGTNDLRITNGNLVLIDDPAAEAAIVLRNKFLFCLGEYFLDTREGVPYFQYVFVKNPDTLIIRAIFSAIILGTEGIQSLISLEVTRNKDRTGKFSFRARATNGKIVTGGSGEPFIVETP
jgi:hypothetical protein